MTERTKGKVKRKGRVLLDEQDLILAQISGTGTIPTEDTKHIADLWNASEGMTTEEAVKALKWYPQLIIATKAYKELSDLLNRPSGVLNAILAKLEEK